MPEAQPVDIIAYEDSPGSAPFLRWQDGLDSQARAKIATLLLRVAEGNLSSAKSAGGGVSEFRIDFGPGYRIYFGKVGTTLVILLAGGTKKRQQADIVTAKTHWLRYKLEKRRSK